MWKKYSFWARGRRWIHVNDQAVSQHIYLKLVSPSLLSNVSTKSELCSEIDPLIVFSWMQNYVHFVNRGLLFSFGYLQRQSMRGKSSLCKKCHHLDIWSQSRMRQPSVPLTVFVLCFPMPQHFDLSKLPCVVLFVLMQHLLLCLAAYCISLNSITVSLLCIWTGATFWSVAPLLGWGSYTGLMLINICYFCNISIIHPHLVLFLRPKIAVTARVRWTGPKPTTLPFTSPISSPSSSSAFSSLW